MFAIATLQDRDIQALFVTYLAQSGTTRKNWSLCNSVQLEDWSELWTQSQFVRLGLGLQKESLHLFLPQLKVEFHDDQTFLVKKPLSTFFLLSSIF